MPRELMAMLIIAGGLAFWVGLVISQTFQSHTAQRTCTAVCSEYEPPQLGHVADGVCWCLAGEQKP